VEALQSLSSKNPKVQATAAEYATFCITDNPDQRDLVVTVPNIYKTVVKLVASDNAHVSAMASHLIYIASFNNYDNHWGFFKANAITALATVMKTKTNAAQLMWAAAALQNLAASYCKTKDGRCWWEWYAGQDDAPVIDFENLPVTSDGTTMRLVMLQDKALVETLLTWACQGPVSGEMTEKNVYPGDNAVIGRDEEIKNIVPWAAVGALKNIALEPEAHPLLEPAVRCFCKMSHSKDWLEENKGQGVIKHLRRSDPCRFKNKKDPFSELCIDMEFMDAERYHCDDYGKATEKECQAPDEKNPKLLAKEACCGCGGGDRATNVKNEL
jgi:hypothetical protein